MVNLHENSVCGVVRAAGLVTQIWRGYDSRWPPKYAYFKLISFSISLQTPFSVSKIQTHA